MRFIRLSETASDIALPFVGTTLACCRLAMTGDVLGFPLPIMQAVQAIWKNIITLRSPADDDAILVARCIVKSAAKRKLSKNSDPITTKELSTDAKIEVHLVINALAKLHKLKIIAVDWAKESDDFQNLENAWRIAL